MQKCGTPVRTDETVAEYRAFSKDKRLSAKDIGGFFGGRLEAGRRVKGSVICRTLLTLDADNATPETWPRFCAEYPGVMALCYSTHSHTPEAPRLRIVAPFDREVAPAEYEAISRRVCDRVGAEYFDSTTHDVNRLMFWPSASSDAEFYFQSRVGAPLCADSILATYTDWRDRSQWPGVADDALRPPGTADKPADPTTKPGLIGAFCRVYDVPGAIAKYLPDVYTPATTHDGTPARYTYTGGTTYGGAVIYDDGAFIYSHHDHDPAGGKTLNAFDLVRVHKFGKLDGNAKPGTPVNRLPSYLAMNELCARDTEVCAEMARARIISAGDDFAGVDAPDGQHAKEVADVIGQLTTDKKGRVVNTPHNRAVIINADPVLRHVRRNDLTGADEADTAILTGAPDGEACGVDDGTLVRISRYVYRAYGFEIQPRKILEELAPRNEARAFHPVKDFITAVEWDDVPRVESLLVDYLGAPDTPLTREVTRKWMTAAVMRIWEPGAEFQNVLTLTGGQGIGKSYFLRQLAVCPEWFTDALCLDSDARARREATQGKWLIEINELAGIGRAEWQGLKGYISQSVDRGRPAYGLTVKETPRQFVFAATTNDDSFIRESDKGNRRWWVVPVSRRGREWPRDEAEKVALLHQIWAEAYRMYRRNQVTVGDVNSLSEAGAAEMSARQFECSDDNDTELREAITRYLCTPPQPDYGHATTAERRAYYQDFGDLADIGDTPRRTKFYAGAFLSDFYLPGAANDTARRQLTRKVNAIMRNTPGWKWQTIRHEGYRTPVKGFERIRVIPGAPGDDPDDADLL